MRGEGDMKEILCDGVFIKGTKKGVFYVGLIQMR
jgi:hypothetical protein